MDTQLEQPVPSLREAQKEVTRGLLVEAAQAAFEQHGYLEVTVEDICCRAGVSRPTFYAYFDNKAQVLEAVERKLEVREEYLLLFERLRRSEVPLLEALEDWFDGFVDFYQKHLGIHQALHEARAIEPEFARSLRVDLDKFVDLWTSLGFVDDPNDEELRLGALMMFAMGEQFMYLWLVQGFEVDRKQAVRALARSLQSVFRRAG